MIRQRFTSSRIRRQRRKKLFVSAFLYVILAVSIGALVVEAANIKQLRIDVIVLEGNRAITKTELFDVLAPKLVGSYLGLFSKRNIFLFPRRAMERALLDSFIRLEDVSISRSGLHKLSIVVVERDPTGLWCPPPPGEKTASCLFVDETGLGFAPAPRITGKSFLIYKKPFAGEGLGEFVAVADDFKKLNEFVALLAALGFRAREVEWNDDSLDFSTRLSTERVKDATVTLRVPLLPPYDQALSNIASLMQSINAEGEASDFSFDDLEYIDLRFESKIFYKEGFAPESIME